VVVGQLGGSADLVRTLGQALRLLGSTVLTIDSIDGADQASGANRFDADVYVGLLATTDEPNIAYYATRGFESLGGRRLAELLSTELSTVNGLSVRLPMGMRLPVLRETRMPAVVVELGPPTMLDGVIPLVAGAIARALAYWVAAPVSAPLPRG
jgi:N-acetylmuramoyl-L-alanine amidase